MELIAELLQIFHKPIENAHFYVYNCSKERYKRKGHGVGIQEEYS